MPELAEVKLMSDFINTTNKKHGPFQGVRVNPKTKVKTSLLPLKGNFEYTIEAETRGKELRLTFRRLDGSIISQPNGIDESLYFAMGMSGNWGFATGGDLNQTVQTLSNKNHIKLTFPSKRGMLVMYDVRNFAKWKWSDKWSTRRGPDPFEQFTEFKQFILTEQHHPRRSKLRNKPLSEILMDQYYFNGIGNYLRAEILYRLDVDPFQTWDDLTEEKQTELLQLCHDIPALAYQKGGGEFYTFKNPATADRESGIGELIQCYGRKDKEEIRNIVDSSGRRFWYHEKWEVDK